MKRAQLVELEQAVNARYLITAETAQGYNGGPNDSEHMYRYYDARAQGQYDILTMIRSAIEIADNIGTWE